MLQEAQGRLSHQIDYGSYDLIKINAEFTKTSSQHYLSPALLQDPSNDITLEVMIRAKKKDGLQMQTKALRFPLGLQWWPTPSLW